MADGTVISGGRDRRVIVHRGAGGYKIDVGFPVYAVGLSKDGKTGIYSEGDEQILRVFDTATGRKLHRLIGHKAMVGKILDIGGGRFLSTERGKRILMWCLPANGDKE